MQDWPTLCAHSDCALAFWSGMSLGALAVYIVVVILHRVAK